MPLLPREDTGQRCLLTVKLVKEALTWSTLLPGSSTPRRPDPGEKYMVVVYKRASVHDVLNRSPNRPRQTETGVLQSQVKDCLEPTHIWKEWAEKDSP